MKSNIALIGFMGSGKSTVGKALAGQLKMDFVELDALVEQKAGRSIAEIFEHEGEPAFRKLEAQVACEAAGRRRTVISCGGGIVLDPASVDCLKQNALMVYLKARPDIILKRVGGSGDVRPLLRSADPSLTINDMLAARRPLYEKAADIVIDTSRLTVVAVVGKIVAELPSDASINL